MRGAAIIRIHGTPFPLLEACVACHETFKLTEWPDNKTYTRPEPIPLDLPSGVTIRE
ncbi:hypothetical protein SAMN03097708_00822 [Thiohalomonas denitrificans]|uniref:Uncharacterized protein n=1 Tax=Thiohalomonas denitrificans TaxID=415747 RepID=A0A1G5PUI6_9GAMM|nr:hypothetical protein SAMN03097708_00822 [Thiohalomonas denitrificans]